MRAAKPRPLAEAEALDHQVGKALAAATPRVACVQVARGQGLLAQVVLGQAPVVRRRPTGRGAGPARLVAAAAVAQVLLGHGLRVGAYVLRAEGLPVPLGTSLEMLPEAAGRRRPSPTARSAGPVARLVWPARAPARPDAGPLARPRAARGLAERARKLPVLDPIAQVAVEAARPRGLGAAAATRKELAGRGPTKADVADR